MVKDKRCKCAHLKSEHGRFIKTCHICPCSEYMKREMPNIASKISLILGISLIVITFVSIGMIVWSFDELKKINPEAFDQPVDLTVGEFVDIMFLVIIGFKTLFWTIWVQPLIIDYFLEKKRKDWNK